MSEGNNKKKLSFTTVRVVKEVMATKSLTKAAVKLDISQPAVSTHLRRFEDAVGISPMIRVGNEMVVASPEAFKLIEELIVLEGKLLKIGSQRKDAPRRLGACQYWGMPIIENFERSKSLHNRYDVCVDCSKKLADMFLEGDLDILIRPILPGEDPILSRNLPLSWAGNFRVGRISEDKPLRVILGNPMAPFGRSGRDWLETRGIKYTVAMECDNPSLLPSLCKNLEAITPVPRTFAENGGFLFQDAFGVLANNFEMTLGLFYSDRTTSYLEAEECFENFVATVTPIQQNLYLAR